MQFSENQKNFLVKSVVYLSFINTLIISKHITNNSVLIYKKTKKISKPFSINFKTVIGDTVSFRSKIKTDLYIDYSKLEKSYDFFKEILFELNFLIVLPNFSSFLKQAINKIKDFFLSFI